MTTETSDLSPLAPTPTSVRLDRDFETRLKRQIRRLGSTKASILRLALGYGLEAIERAESMVLVRERSNWNWP